jgi:hypothetical protein
MFREPNVKVLAELLRACLDKGRQEEAKHANRVTA